MKRSIQERIARSNPDLVREMEKITQREEELAIKQEELETQRQELWLNFSDSVALTTIFGVEFKGLPTTEDLLPYRHLLHELANIDDIRGRKTGNFFGVEVRHPTPRS